MARTYIPGSYVTRISRSQFESEKGGYVTRRVVEDTLPLLIAQIPQKFFCSSCDYVTSRRANMERHIKYIHKTKIKPSFCICCQTEFKDMSDLKHHKMIVHIEGYNCKFCTKSFKNFYSFKRHYKAKHIDHSSTNGGTKLVHYKNKIYSESHETSVKDGFLEDLTVDTYSNSSTSSSQIVDSLGSNASYSLLEGYNSSSCEIPKFKDLGALNNYEIVDSSNTSICVRGPSTSTFLTPPSSSKPSIASTVMIDHPFRDLKSDTNQNVPASSSDKRNFDQNQCPYCPFTFKFKKYLKHHCKIYHNFELVKSQRNHGVCRIYCCPRCEYSAKTKIAIIKHCKLLHTYNYNPDKTNRANLKPEPDSTTTWPIPKTPADDKDGKQKFEASEVNDCSLSLFSRNAFPPSYKSVISSNSKMSYSNADNEECGKDEFFGNAVHRNILLPSYESAVSSTSRFHQSQILDSNQMQSKKTSDFQAPNLIATINSGIFKMEPNGSNISGHYSAPQLATNLKNQKSKFTKNHTNCQGLDTFPMPPTLDQTYHKASELFPSQYTNRIDVPKFKIEQSNSQVLDMFLTPEFTSSCKFNFETDQTIFKALELMPTSALKSSVVTTTEQTNCHVLDKFPTMGFESKVKIDETDLKILNLFSDPDLSIPVNFQDYVCYVEIEDLTLDKSDFPNISWDELGYDLPEFWDNIVPLNSSENEYILII